MLRYKEIEKLHIELSSHCNSSCPTCPRNVDGGIISPFLKPNSLSREQFEQIFSSRFLQQITGINFCGNYGDPILCKDLIKILDYIAEANSNMGIVLHTNGGVRNLEFWKTLGHLSAFKFRDFRVIFSIDGLEDTNHLYRIGVKWEKLMANVRAFLSIGGKAEWDMLVFKHNQHQVEKAKRLSKKLGFQKFIEGKPHGFKYNNTIRVVNSKGEFERLIFKADKFAIKEEVNSNQFENINFNITQSIASENFYNLKSSCLDKTNKFYPLLMDKIKKYDSVEIKTCMAKEFKEIYVDSNGGVHPCCYLGHINQEFLSTPELIMHKKWIEDVIGMDNINALSHPLKTILDSNYFQLIQNSWSKTIDQGKNPMCVFKCGVQRPNSLIRIE